MSWSMSFKGTKDEVRQQVEDFHRTYPYFTENALSAATAVLDFTTPPSDGKLLVLTTHGHDDGKTAEGSFTTHFILKD